MAAMLASPERMELLDLATVEGSVPVAAAERFSLVGYPERPGEKRARAASVATPLARTQPALALAAAVISAEAVAAPIPFNLCTTRVAAVAEARALLPLGPQMSVPGQRTRERLMVLRQLRRRRSVR